MSMPPDFISNPNYLSLFMVWASGYLLAYAVFRKSRIWKDFDAVMKLVVALVLGFAIEIALVFPFFFVVSGGATQSFLPTLYSTWIIQGLFTLILLYGVYKNTTHEFINDLFGRILFFGFLGITIAIMGFLVGWGLFYDNAFKLTTIASRDALVYLLLLTGFSSIFCWIFAQCTIHAYADQIRQKRLVDFSAINSLKPKRKHTVRNLAIFVSVIFGISLLAIPISTALSVGMPNVRYTENGKASDGATNLFLGVDAFVRGVPTIDTNFSRVTYSYYTITPAKIGGSSNVIVLLPENLQTRNLRVADGTSNVYNWNDVIAFADYENVSLHILPNDYEVKGLNVSYSKNADRPFNITFAYWVNVEVNDLSITPQPVVCNKYNETMNQWIYRFTITNNDVHFFDIKEIQFYGYIYNDEVNNTAAYARIDDIGVGGSVSVTKLLLNWAVIPVNKTVNLEVAFLSPNSL